MKSNKDALQDYLGEYINASEEIIKKESTKLSGIKTIVAALNRINPADIVHIELLRRSGITILNPNVADAPPVPSLMLVVDNTKST